MIDNNAQLVMEMQQSQSQASRSKAVSTATPSNDQSFSGYLNKSQKTYKEKDGTSVSNAKTSEGDKPRNIEQKTQSVVPEKPESQPVKQVQNSAGEKNRDGESALNEAKGSQSTVVSRSEEKLVEEKTEEVAKKEERMTGEAIDDLQNDESISDQHLARSLTDFIKLLLQQESRAEDDILSESDAESITENVKLTGLQLIEKLIDGKNILGLSENKNEKLSAEELVGKVIDTKSLAGGSPALLGIDGDQQARLLAELAKRILSEKELGVGLEGKAERPVLAENMVNSALKKEVLSDLRLENLPTLDEKALAADIDAEALLTKFVERLDLHKINSEVMLQNKILGNKNTMMPDFSDQLMAKSNIESLDRASMLSSLGVAGRPLTSAALAVPQQLTLQAQVDSPEWGSEFNKRIQFLVKSNMQHAELRLDPPELGKIQVKINLSQDQASVMFVSQSGNVRDAIEQAMPRLRELLNESGIQLGNADVSSQFQQKNENSTERDSTPSASSQLADYDDDGESELIPHSATVYSVDGVIDYFA